MSDGCDADDFDLDFGEAEADGDCCTILRATFLRDGRIALTPGCPASRKAARRECTSAHERAGVTIADLRLVRTEAGEREVIVEFMAGGHGRKPAEAALRSWARGTGQRRVWLPFGPVAVEAPDWLATGDRPLPNLPRHLDGINPRVLGRRPPQRPLPPDLSHLRTHTAAVEG